jgi:hypothetical protein
MMGLSPVLNLDLAQTEIRTMNVFASCAPSTGHAFQGGIEPVYLQVNSLVNRSKMRPANACAQMYRDAMQGIHDNLIQRTPTSNITYIAEFMLDDYDNWKTYVRMHVIYFASPALQVLEVTA